MRVVRLLAALPPTGRFDIVKLFVTYLLQADVLHIRFADSDTAVAEVRFRLVGYTALPPGIGETAPGVLETRLVDVLQKIDGHWRIVFSQNTAIVPL